MCGKTFFLLPKSQLASELQNHFKYDEEAENAFTEQFNFKRNDKRLKRFFVSLVIFQMSADPWALFEKFKKEFLQLET